MTGIILELNAIEDIKNRLESLVQKSQRIDSTEFNKLVRRRTGFLDKNERNVLKFIEDNPGIWAQNIVDSLQVPITRKPVFKAIKSLVKRRMVHQVPDDTNSRILRLYVNKENLIIQVGKEIKDFKKSYLKLIRRTNEEFGKKKDLTEDELKKSRRPAVDIAEIYSAGVANGLIDIFRQLLTSYSLYAIFKWPREISDLESLNILYLTVFQSLKEIYSELVKNVPFDIEDEHKRIEYLEEGLKYSFEDAQMYVRMIPEFDEYNAGVEFDSVMSNLFNSIKMPISWKDYRERQNEAPIHPS